ncbi:MAG: DDE-type integrase/transposase/recombinase [Gammaproteobacteria bacterium]|nr:DDE-type integrase/transposase/recombinase [Gammaproteobacteria bacterium]
MDQGNANSETDTADEGTQDDSSANSDTGNGEPWDDQMVLRAQGEDDDLLFLSPWLKDATEPDMAELKLASQNQKFYWANRNRFKIAEGIIYHMGEERDQLVIPKSLKGEILRLCHDIPSSGHQGISRTKERIKRYYFWYKMNKDVVEHISKCHECALSKTSNRKLKYPMVQNHAGIPMEKVHIDFLGPLPTSAQGNEYILVMVDSFTKWIECIPLPSQTAEVTARAAVNEFFTRFGYPLQLVSDQGRNFESALFQEMCKLLHIRKSRTTAYRPSANGQAERMNRTLMAAVRCFIGQCQEDWDIYVPLIASAMRSAVNRHTGFTPNRLMLGREVNTPAEIMVPHPMDRSTSHADFVSDLETNMQLAHQTARGTLKVELKRAKTHFDLNKKVATFQKGDVVYCLDHAPANKLHPKWIGPCVVLQVRSPFLFRIKFRNREWTVNHNSLKSCMEDNLPAWIGKVIDKIRRDALLTYCICRKPDDGLLMVQCLRCLDWFHGQCIKLTRAQALAIDYVCVECQG